MFVRFGNDILNTSNISHIYIGYELLGSCYMIVSFVDNRGNKNKFTLYPSEFKGYEYTEENFMNGFCNCLRTSLNEFNDIKEYLSRC